MGKACSGASLALIVRQGRGVRVAAIPAQPLNDSQIRVIPVEVNCRTCPTVRHFAASFGVQSPHATMSLVYRSLAFLPPWEGILLLGTVALVAFLVPYVYASRRPKDFPPGPTPLPMIGNIHQLPPTKAFLKFVGLQLPRRSDLASSRRT